MIKMREELQGDLTRLMIKLRASDERMAALEKRAYRDGCDIMQSEEYHREYDLNWSLAEHIEDLKTALHCIKD